MAITPKKFVTASSNGGNGGYGSHTRAIEVKAAGDSDAWDILSHPSLAAPALHNALAAIYEYVCEHELQPGAMIAATKVDELAIARAKAEGIKCNLKIPNEPWRYVSYDTPTGCLWYCTIGNAARGKVRGATERDKVAIAKTMERYQLTSDVITLR